MDPPEGARGVDLLAAPEPRPCLTEYHGLYDYRVTELLEAGYSEERVERYDAPLRGLAAGTGYYGYETQEGFIESGTGRPEDPQALLAELVAGLDARDTGGDGEETSGALAARLEDLGYL